MINRLWLMQEYEDALKEPDPMIKRLRLAFLITLIEDHKLLEELAKK